MAETTVEPFDSYIGVHPSCGCISAWMSKRYSDRSDVREFYREMADSGREVRQANLDEIRDKIGTCAHKAAQGDEKDG